FVFILITTPLNSIGVALGLVIQLLSATLFAWSIRWTYRKRLSVAYNTDTPAFILTGGPFQLVRHPFYTSYMLFWISLVIMQPTLINGIATIALCALYLDAALFEESKFAQSPLSSAYQEYSKRTGMFVPRIRFPIR